METRRRFKDHNEALDTIKDSLMVLMRDVPLMMLPYPSGIPPAPLSDHERVQSIRQIRTVVEWFDRGFKNQVWTKGREAP
jgi:hypothetical protein